MLARIRVTLSLLTIVAGISLINYVVPHDYAFALFYLVAIAAASWWVGRVAGLLVAGTSVLAWAVVDLLTHPPSYERALIWNSFARATIFLSAAYFIARQHRTVLRLGSQREELFRLAITDDVTGLYNRHFMREEGNRLVKVAIRHRRPFSVVVLTVHGGGQNHDRVLRTVAQLLRENLHDGDLAIRLGAADLLAVMPEAQEDDAARLAAALQAACAGSLELTAREVTVSTATASWRFGLNFEDVVDAAVAGLGDVA